MSLGFGVAWAWAVWAGLGEAPAHADECLCLEWEDTWQWSDCAESGASCACDCTDDVAHGGATTSDAAVGQACSDEGLVGAPRTGATCEIASSTCVSSDCCDDVNADCPGEEAGCGCDAGSAGPAGFAALGLAAAALLRGRRRAR